MKDELAIEKAKKYLIKLKKSKVLKKQSELLELKEIIEQLDSLQFKLKRERNFNVIWKMENN